MLPNELLKPWRHCEPALFAGEAIQKSSYYIFLDCFVAKNASRNDASVEAARNEAAVVALLLKKQ